MNHFHQSEILDIIDNQSALVLVSPIDIITTPGVINYVTGLLAFNEINVTQILGSYTDTIIVINRADALKAFQVLEQRIIDLQQLAKKIKK